jgi:hypothetical protein
VIVAARKAVFCGRGRVRNGRGDAFRQDNLHRMRVAQRHVEVLAGRFGAVADAAQFHHLGETGAGADDGVVEQRAGQAMQRTMLRRVRRTLHHKGAVLLFKCHVRRDFTVTVPLGPFTVTMPSVCV